MPASDACSLASRGRGEAVMATGSQVPAWLLVEVRGAWGADAVHDSALGEYVPADWKDGLRGRGVRAVCVRQAARRDADGVRLFFETVRRPPMVGRLWTRTVASLADVAAAAAGLAASRPDPAGWVPADHPLALVCTNGRHDQCCANEGRPVVRALRGSAWDDHVWECSHVGGDRFAANVVVLPESLYFGRCTPDGIVSLLDGVAAGQLDLDHFRGRSGYRTVEQAVEHLVRRRLGVVAEGAVRVQPGGAEQFDVEVGAGGPDRAPTARYVATLEVAWTVLDEALTCRGRPNQRVPSFRLAALEAR